MITQIHNPNQKTKKNKKGQLRKKNKEKYWMQGGVLQELGKGRARRWVGGGQ